MTQGEKAAKHFHLNVFESFSLQEKCTSCTDNSKDSLGFTEIYFRQGCPLTPFEYFI